MDRNEISQNQSVLINNVTKTFSNLSTIGWNAVSNHVSIVLYRWV